MGGKGRKTVTVDGVFDIETENWSTFVCGGLWTPRAGFRVWSWREEEFFVDELLRTEGSIWAHNGGRFDALWFLQHVVERGLKAKVRCSGQRIITIEVGKLKIRDSLALVPMSLEKAAEMGTVRKARTELACVCGDKCGGYCSIKRDMHPKEYAALVSYLRLDCEATASFMKAVVEYAADHDLDLCSTIGASSYASARRYSGLSDADWDARDGSSPYVVYRRVRDAYFGGRTQVFRPLAPSGFRYDINSAYPAALSSLSLPTGEWNDVSGRQARKAYESGKPGTYRAVVRIPECFCPPLPVRGIDRISYPTGQVKGTWSANELAYAEECGVRIESISEGVSWNSSEMVLAPFCRYVWSLRDKAGPKTALGTWLKWFANSLTGKLAQRPETESVAVNPPVGSTFCHASYPCGGIHPAPDCCEHRCTKTCGGWTELAPTIFVKTLYRLSECAHVHFAAYLTAHTRITLHKQLVDDSDGGRSAVYCDTDSVISTSKRTRNIGDQLGQFKEEGRFENFQAIAPKTYAYHDPDTGKFIARAKGIPDAARNFGDILSGKSVPVSRGVNSFRSAARSGRGLFARKLLARQVSNDGLWYGDRKLGKDGRTWPTDAGEMRP